MANSVWLSAHVFHQGDFDALIGDFLGPLIDELLTECLASSFFFLRHWQGGPHLRVRIRTDAEKAVRQLMELRVRAYLEAHPSCDAVDPDWFLAASAYLAQREGLPVMEVRYANDSLQFIPYRFDGERYGTTAVEAVERHFAESSQLALSLVRAGITQPQRQMMGMSAVILSQLAARDASDISRHLHATWRFWSELSPQAADPEPEFARLYEKQNGQLAPQIAQLYCVRDPLGGSKIRPETAWWDSVNHLRAVLADNDEAAATILDACAHLLCNRLGLPPRLESCLRYLAARATAEIENGRGGAHSALTDA
jgi:thiopeptide-type bacteriocin biosynthesis protein